MFYLSSVAATEMTTSTYMYISAPYLSNFVVDAVSGPKICLNALDPGNGIHKIQVFNFKPCKGNTD